MPSPIGRIFGKRPRDQTYLEHALREARLSLRRAVEHRDLDAFERKEIERLRKAIDRDAG